MDKFEFETSKNQTFVTTEKYQIKGEQL